jgi:hypothetical protein
MQTLFVVAVPFIETKLLLKKKKATLDFACATILNNTLGFPSPEGANCYSPGRQAGRQAWVM